MRSRAQVQPAGARLVAAPVAAGACGVVKVLARDHAYRPAAAARDDQVPQAQRDEHGVHALARQVGTACSSRPQRARGRPLPRRGMGARCSTWRQPCICRRGVKHATQRLSALCMWACDALQNALQHVMRLGGSRGPHLTLGGQRSMNGRRSTNASGRARLSASASASAPSGVRARLCFMLYLRAPCLRASAAFTACQNTHRARACRLCGHALQTRCDSEAWDLRAGSTTPGRDWTGAQPAAAHLDRSSASGAPRAGPCPFCCCCWHTSHAACRPWCSCRSCSSSLASVIPCRLHGSAASVSGHAGHTPQPAQQP